MRGTIISGCSSIVRAAVDNTPIAEIAQSLVIAVDYSSSEFSIIHTLPASTSSSLLLAPPSETFPIKVFPAWLSLLCFLFNGGDSHDLGVGYDRESGGYRKAISLSAPKSKAWISFGLCLSVRSSTLVNNNKVVERNSAGGLISDIRHMDAELVMKDKRCCKN